MVALGPEELQIVFDLVVRQVRVHFDYFAAMLKEIHLQVRLVLPDAKDG